MACPKEEKNEKENESTCQITAVSLQISSSFTAIISGICGSSRIISPKALLNKRKRLLQEK